MPPGNVRVRHEHLAQSGAVEHLQLRAVDGLIG
jgi:hypothetical protein